MIFERTHGYGGGGVVSGRNSSHHGRTGRFAAMSRAKATAQTAALILDFTVPSLPASITFSRADAVTCATRFNSSGTLETVAADVPRFDYDPATLMPKGLLIEEAGTNSIRNNTMVGAVAGTPGTLPTNWTTTSGDSGLAQTVVGTGTENGISYIDLRFVGTTNNTVRRIFSEVNNNIAASEGQVWTGSAYVAMVAGSMTNVASVKVAVYDYNAVPAAITSSTGSAIALTSTMQRSSVTQTSIATTAWVRPDVEMTFSSGAAIDITLRIGLPQLELGATASSVIPTTTTALTRAADVCSMTGTNFSSWFNATEGTFVVSGDTVGVAAARTLLSANDASEANFISVGIDASANPTASVTTGSAPQAAIDCGTAAANRVSKMALAYKANDIAASWNGGTVGTDTSATLPAVTQMTIGKNSTTTATLNGHISSITYYNTRLPNATLQRLSA